MITKILKAIYYPFYLLTKRHYLVSGTFKDQYDERMFFSTVFETSFRRFPKQAIELEMGKNFKAKTGKVLITGIQPIPRWMAKCIETEEYDKQYDFAITKA